MNQILNRDTTVLNFQFKITHQLLACGYNLMICKIRDSNTCDLCNEDIDTIEHLIILITFGISGLKLVDKKHESYI